MPHITISVAKPLDAATKDTLQLAIGNSMPILPNKTIANTVINIADGCSMYRDGQPLEGVYADVRLYKASPVESKKAFAEKLFSIFEEVLGIPPERVQINFVELPDWASNGKYF